MLNCMSVSKSLGHFSKTVQHMVQRVKFHTNAFTPYSHARENIDLCVASFVHIESSIVGINLCQTENKAYDMDLCRCKQSKTMAQRCERKRPIRIKYQRSTMFRKTSVCIQPRVRDPGSQ